jgi:hypothetical protein
MQVRCNNWQHTETTSPSMHHACIRHVEIGETLSAGCGFTIEELQDAERAFAAAGAKVRVFFPSLSNILTPYSP